MTAQQTAARYEAEQTEGRPETDPLHKMWDVVDITTGKVAASWRETPITGMTEKEAVELAEAWNAMEV